MLLELAIGDAYGAGFEYEDPDEKRPNTAEQYVKQTRHRIAPGSYTDDTQMSLAVAEALVAVDEWTPRNLAARFVDCFHRDPREGYAGAFYEFLCKTRSAVEFLANIRPDSDKSGAAMRACPLGVLPTVAEVLEKCRIQAAITHNTPDGIHAAQAAALTAHYFLYRLGPKAEVGRFLVAHVPGQWNTPYEGKVKSKGWMSVRAAITAVRECESLRDLLVRCVAFTGDVDTVATIALGAAAHSEEYRQDIPERLVETLENGPYGRDYVIDLDRRLLALCRKTND